MSELRVSHFLCLLKRRKWKPKSFVPKLQWYVPSSSGFFDLEEEGCEASILKPFFLLWWLHCQELWFIFFLCETAQTVKLTSLNESSVEWSTHRWSLLKKSSERSFKRRLSLGFSVRFSSRMYRPAGGWILKSFVETPAFMAGDLCRWPRTRWAGWYGFLSPVVLLLWLVFSFILH